MLILDLILKVINHLTRTALFPGSFDPFTVGHVDIVQRALNLFDKMVIGVGNNSTKQSMFSLEQRMKWIHDSLTDKAKIEVASYNGLTVDFAKKINAQFILRGLRTSTDFQFEKAIAQMNTLMNEKIETIFMLSLPEFAPVSSTIVRDIIRNSGDVSRFVAKGVKL